MALVETLVRVCFKDGDSAIVRHSALKTWVSWSRPLLHGQTVKESHCLCLLQPPGVVGCRDVCGDGEYCEMVRGNDYSYFTTQIKPAREQSVRVSIIKLIQIYINEVNTGRGQKQHYPTWNLDLNTFS